MIRLERSPAPKALFGESVTGTYQEAEEFFANETRYARRTRFNFDFWLWQTEEVFSALTRTSSGRCWFCGRPDRSPEGEDFIPHRFRPPQDAVAADGRTSRRHYWWLAYEWNNLYLACEDCHTAQGSKFPTARRRVRVGSRDELNERERPLLIDPIWEDPEPHFVYLDSGEITWFTERGLITIETFDLNRPRLVQERREWITVTRGEIREAAAMATAGRSRDFLEAFLWLYSTEAPFAALRRQFFNQWAWVRPHKIEAILGDVTEGAITLGRTAGSLQRITGRVKSNLSSRLGRAVVEEPGMSAPGESYEGLREPAERGSASKEHLVEIRESVRPVDELSAPLHDLEVDASTYEESREIHEVEIHNFQGIESMRLEVAGGAGEGSWLMLLGENGAGKTAALKAIALTLMASKDRETVLKDSPEILRYGEQSGRVRIDLAGARNFRELHLERGEDPQAAGSQAPSLLAAYGATRLLPADLEPGSRGLGVRTGSLFDARFPLTRPADWLPDLSRDKFDAVARGLHTILRLADDEQIRRNNRTGLQIESPRGPFDLTSLSDGYRTMTILALDMMQLFLSRWDNLEAAEGIVLIDEIGAHLHPRWQMKVVSTFRRTFPRVQFIATTHDPLCLRGLGEGEVVVLHRHDGRLIVQQRGLPSVRGLTVDQLLTSEHFGLFSTLDPEVEAIFDRYYELLAQTELTAAEEEDLLTLRTWLDRYRQLGRTRRERLALEAVDRYLADERNATSPDDLQRLPEAARESVRRLLDGFTRS